MKTDPHLINSALNSIKFGTKRMQQKHKERFMENSPSTWKQVDALHIICQVLQYATAEDLQRILDRKPIFTQGENHE